MKSTPSALFVLSVLAGITTPANALDTRTFPEQQKRQSHRSSRGRGGTRRRGHPSPA
jgi:hypothetical protein